MAEPSQTLLAALYPPELVRLAVAGLKAEQDRAECCEGLSEEPGVLRLLDVARRWLGTDTLQRAERAGL